MKISEKNIERIKQLCKEYKVKNFSVFSSVLTDNFSLESDIEIIGEAVNRITNYKNTKIKIQNAR
jgi:predicted nucleotidyltransferase|tara:strand:+ start:68 stop:262 length:195 start_codon:yes stop_codon:yes gene_type:complete